MGTAVNIMEQMQAQVSNSLIKEQNVSNKQIVQQDLTLTFEQEVGNPGEKKQLNRAVTDLPSSHTISLCKMAPPGDQEPSVEHPLSWAKGPLLPARFSAVNQAWLGNTSLGTFIQFNTDQRYADFYNKGKKLDLPLGPVTSSCRSGSSFSSKTEHNDSIRFNLKKNL